VIVINHKPSDVRRWQGDRMSNDP